MELNVVVKLEIFPQDVETDLNKIQSELTRITNEHGKVHKAEITPIAFGLNSLHATLLLNDKKGGIEKIEEKLKALKGVSEVKVTDMSLI